MNFIGRINELHVIRKMLHTSHNSIGVIYGRRRIGKSLLISESLKNRKVYYFEGLENRTKQEQLSHFIFQLRTISDTPTLPQVKTWKEAFILLYEQIKADPRDIVFDEFQWMANYRQEIISDLKFVWDRFFSNITNVSLLLCGSIASFMTTKVIKSTALYGRIDMEINLKAFNLNDTVKMLKGKSDIECIEAHLFTGGVPKYLDLLSEETSIRLGMEELCFTQTGYFFSEYERIFISHFGRNPEYEKIIKVLVKYSDGLFRKDIASHANIATGGLLSEHLFNLESAGFINSYIPFNKNGNTRQIKYFISDAYIRFYWTFIQKNRRRIMDGISGNYFNQIANTGEFYNWMGKSFEYLCFQHATVIAGILGFSGIHYTYGPYFKPRYKCKDGVQIDLLFDRKDNVISLCEIKYSQSKIGLSIIESIERKVDLLRPVSKGKTIQRVLITMSPPSKDLINSGYFYKIIQAKELIESIQHQLN